MNCGDLSAALLKAALPPEAEDHLRTCARCRGFVAAISAAPGDAPTPAALREIETRLLADLRAVSPISSRPVLFGLILIGIVFVVAASVYFIGAFTEMSPIQAAGILATLAISLGLVAHSLVNQMIPGSGARISSTLPPIGILAALAAVVSILFPFQTERSFWQASWGCIRTGIPIGLLAAGSTWLVLRRGAILSPISAGAAAGVLAGLAGTTALEIHCPNLNAWHILAAHLGVAVIGLLFAAAVGAAMESGHRRS